MRAVVAKAAGGPEVLEVQERDVPSPAAGQLLVDVSAAGVNFMDIYGREGRRPYARTPPWVPGVEGAGTVSAVGDGVSGFSAGDVVAWASAPGSYAQRVVVDAGRAVHVPPGVGAERAAAVMLQGITAHYLCHSTYPVAAGDVVVVHAAAGGVGLLLTQMVKRLGGVVVATTSGGDKQEAARRAGADHSIAYGDVGEVVGEVTGGQGAAAVYDGVGAATFEASLAALRRRGVLVLYGAASGPVPPLELTRLMTGGSLYVTRPTMCDYIATREELEWRAGDLLGWVADGSLTVSVAGRYPLDAAGSAHEDLARRRTSGKLLLLP